jgi:glycosyltransferase involved in cell wall biosynthesis
MLFQFPWETQRLNQQHVSDGVDWAIRAYNIDTIIIDYHPSALFLKLLRSDVRTVLIALGMSHHGWLSAKISLFRARLFERRKNSEVDKVIVSGQPDAARYPLRSTPVCITPYLDRKPGKWSLQAGKGLFFVGNIAHYPNRMAIDWIAQKFAPHLLRLCPATRISIVGARPDQLSSNVPNVDCLGPADAEAVRGLFLSGNIMLCPVENDYGVKFKAVEALSYGTPLLASRQTHRGLPQLEGHGAINLEDPAAAARMAADLLENPHVLFAFQAAQQILQSRFIESQKNIWSKTTATIPPK